MEALGRYILSVTAAAILLSILRTIHGKKGTNAALVKLVGGLFLTFTVIVPVVDVDTGSIFSISMDLTEQGSAIAACAAADSSKQLQGIIKQRCEAYILDKALTYGVHLDVDVSLTDEEIPVPASVCLQGSISPYTKAVFGQWLEQDMGIPKEQQLWIG